MQWSKVARQGEDFRGFEAFVQIMGRTAAPQTEAKSADTMNRAYNDARHDYVLNRVHALGSYE